MSSPASSPTTDIIGGALFGLASRFGQLAIQKRPMFTYPLGHVVLMGIFGYAGYWAHRWDIRAAELIEEKRAQIAARRQQHIARIEAHAAAALQE